jgi:hypothetical protein
MQNLSVAAQYVWLRFTFAVAAGIRLTFLLGIAAIRMFAQSGATSIRRPANQAPVSQAIEAAPWVKPAADGVFGLFEQKPVVALGDYHGLAPEEIFYSALIRDQRFAEKVGNVVVEFGGEASQGIIDRYVAGEDVPFTELRRVWTETVGWVSGPTALGYINFYANVRAANLKLLPEHRIKVWLGDPKIDSSTINSFQDVQPYLERRDDNFARIIRDEILKKHQKALLIIGSGHLLGGVSPDTLTGMIENAYPNMLAVVSPFLGYIEPECNAKVVARAKDWPVPAVVGPIGSTWLKSELQLTDCHYIPKEDVPRIKSLVPRQADVRIAAQVSVLSGVDSNAILYLGPPEAFTMLPIDPSIYLDPDYLREENRRLQCCTPGGQPLDWDRLVQQSTLIPMKLSLRIRTISH